MKRRGNRRYYQHHEVLLIRRIRDLLYDQGFTISGARNRLSDLAQGARGAAPPSGATELPPPGDGFDEADTDLSIEASVDTSPLPLPEASECTMQQMRQELQSIRDLLAQ
jgi:DNA-binding transcriptional MerR regulator